VERSSYDRSNGKCDLSREERGEAGEGEEGEGGEEGKEGKEGKEGEVVDRSTTKAAERIVEEHRVVSELQGGEGPISAAACTDDYAHWKAHDYAPPHGKPVWVTDDDEENQKSLHIFFDDHINNGGRGFAVAVRGLEQNGLELVIFFC
jgi:hypothetical protein